LARVRFVVLLVWTLALGTSVAGATPPAAKPPRSPRPARMAESYRTTLRDLVAKGHRDGIDNVLLLGGYTLLAAPAAIQRPWLAPVLLALGTGFGAESASRLGWRDGDVTRPRGLAGAPFRLVTHFGVGLALCIGAATRACAARGRP
jgi:hypothetical protein